MNKRKILVVEDDSSIRYCMKELLETEGYAVECATNGDEGIRALRGAVRRNEPLPNLVLLDLSMPVMDGFQFRKEQGQDPTLAGVSVVVMTADGDAKTKSARVGAQGSITKPFNIEKLVGVVKKYCI